MSPKPSHSIPQANSTSLNEMVITPTSTEEWIRQAAPTLAFHSKAKGGGFVGRRVLKPLLVAKAAKDFKGGYDAESFSEAFENLCKKGFLRQLIQNGKPKGVNGSESRVNAASSAVGKKVQITADQSRTTDGPSTTRGAASMAPGASPSTEAKGISASPKAQRIQLARSSSSASNATNTHTQETPSSSHQTQPTINEALSPRGYASTPVPAPANVKIPPASAPMRFGPTALRTPALVTPGGSLTAETAKDLAAFGGAVIRRGATSQISIALPPSRERRIHTTASASSNSSSTFSNSVGKSHIPSGLGRPASCIDVPDESYSPQSDATRHRSWSLQDHTSQPLRSPQEPPQHWKSLEVSLVDASLLRGFESSFGPSMASPMPSFVVPDFPPMAPQPTPFPERASSETPSRSQVNSSSGHESSPQHTPETTVSKHSFSGSSYPPVQKQQYYTSPANESAYINRPLPATPAQLQAQNNMQSQQQTPQMAPTPQLPTSHDLSRGLSAISPNVTYRPPLRLSEISVPYKVQFHILSLLLQTNEFVFHDFSSKWFPEILIANSWDCPEAADVSMWSKAVLQALNNASGEVNYSSSGSSSAGGGVHENGGPDTPPRVKISRKPPAHALAHLTSLLANIKELNLDHRLRKFISGEKLLWHLDNSMRVCNLLGCNQRAAEVEEITYYVKEALGGIGIVRDAVRGLYNERIESINRKREELARLEREAWEEASSVEREECLKLGWDLAMALDLKIENLKWSGPGSTSLPQAVAGKGREGGMPAAWGGMKKVGFGIGIGEVDQGFPAMAGAGGSASDSNPVQAVPGYFPEKADGYQSGELDRLTQQLQDLGRASADVKGKGKQKAASPHAEVEGQAGGSRAFFPREHEQRPEPPLAADRGRPRAPRNLNQPASTRNTSSNSNVNPHAATHHHHHQPPPPPIPPRHKHRLSTGLFPSSPSPDPAPHSGQEDNNSGSDSESDADDDELEGGTGGGVELTLAQQRLYHYQTGSSTTRSILKRNHTAPHISTTTTTTRRHAEVSTEKEAAAVEMVMIREPAPPSVAHAVVSLSGMITSTTTTTAITTTEIDPTSPTIKAPEVSELPIVDSIPTTQSKIGIVRSNTAPSVIKASDGLTQIFLENPPVV